MKRIKAIAFAVLIGLLGGADYSRAQAVFAGYPCLVTMTNPSPVISLGFGSSVARLGTERILIGAGGDPLNLNPVYGVAYMFDLNGTRLITFTNPNPVSVGEHGDRFGQALTAVGIDKVLIGAYQGDAGTNGAGIAYLFSTNGTLLTTFTNPTPVRFDHFGSAVAAVGADKVLIGAPYDNTAGDYAGAAYLFDLSGALLTTFTIPPPTVSGGFGVSVAAVGTNKVIIGASGVDTGAKNSGAAYLFDLNGTLLTAFANPTPASFEQFGNAVAAVGADRVIIGAYRDGTGAYGAGAVYLFSTNGTLLTTITNPAPEAIGEFGFSLAAVGTDKVLIGARGVDTGAHRSGGAYLFDLKGGLLNIFASPNAALYHDFGFSVAAVGIDQVLIGEEGNPSTSNGNGAAYLFCIPKQNSPFPSLVTVANPNPDFYARFGASIASVGIDKVIVGAPFGYYNPMPGTAYLLDFDGTPLTTFHNPLTTAGDNFGASVAAVRPGTVIIGAPGANIGATSAGVAHLFSTNGSLLATFTNPAPARYDNFGCSVAAVGRDKVIIGAQYADITAYNAGVAYLFSTNTTLLTTFTNPVPTAYGYFGSAVAAAAADKILVGTRESVYLFALDGSLLNTILIPVPRGEDLPASAMVAVSEDRVLVGAPSYGNFPDGGRVYLLDFSGALLTTFTNPAPNSSSSPYYDYFGASVALVSQDKVLIGAPSDDTGATDTGVAYLFDLNGTLLTTIYNPMPTVSDGFGVSVAALGADRIIIGASGKSIGATNAGAAYVFCLPRPQLQIAHGNGTVTVRWENTRLFSGYMLDCSTNLLSPANPIWSEVTFPYQTNALHISVSMPASSGNEFFRLRKL